MDCLLSAGTIKKRKNIKIKNKIIKLGKKNVL